MANAAARRFAQLAADDANFLVLDEPTNHLDLWARDSLERSLLEFDGTVLLVSHDRYFLNRVVDHVLVVEPGRFREVEGNYDAYQHLVSQGLAGGDTAKKAADERETTAAKRSAQAKRQPDRNANSPIAKWPTWRRKSSRANRKVETLHAELATPEALRDGQRVRTIQAEIAEQQSALATLYPHWEEASELN